MGFEQVGFRIVWTNEFNPFFFASLYAYGMTKWKQSIDSNSTEVLISDIRNIERVFAPEIVKKAFPKGKPDFFWNDWWAALSRF